MSSIQAPSEEEVLEDIDEVADLLDDDRDATIRKALTEGLEILRIRVAVQRYQTGEISTSEAADIADCTVAEWLDIAHQKNLTEQYRPEDLADDAATAVDQ